MKNVNTSYNSSTNRSAKMADYMSRTQGCFSSHKPYVYGNDPSVKSSEAASQFIPINKSVDMKGTNMKEEMTTPHFTFKE